MSQHFSRGSSPVDWCEENYSYSPLIAEFFNTVSNALFLVMPPFLMHLHKPYSYSMGPGIQVIWVLLIVVGASSAYFHATLSLLGQLLDEVAILWVVMAGFAMWFPKAAMPPQVKDKRGRRTFINMVIVLTILSTSLGFLQPAFNAFFLMTLGVPSICMLMYNLRKEPDNRTRSLGRRCILLWVLAVACWINDRLLCDAWTSMGFPYLHGFWHVLIFLAAYTGVVLFAYFDVKNHNPYETPEIRYWPVNTFELGVPYVELKSFRYMKGTQKSHHM